MILLKIHSTKHFFSSHTVLGHSCSEASARRRGYALFIAVVVSGIVLAVGLGAASLARKEIMLSSFGRESQVAFYAADTGAECAFRWDIKGDSNGNSVFPTSSPFTGVASPGSGYNCAGTDITNVWSFAGTSGSGGGPMPSGLIGYWTLDTVNISGTTVLDTSGSGNNGTMTAAPTVVAAKINQGISFSAGGSPVITSTTYSNPQDFSVTAWFKTSSASGEKIIGFQAGPNYDRHIYMGTDGKIYCGVWSSGPVLVISAVTLNDNSWHNAICTHNSSNTLQLWIDGVSQGTASGSAYPYSGKWAFGGSSLWAWPADANDGGTFTGILDDIRLYDHALSAAEVAEVYAYGSSSTGGTATTTIPLSFPDGSCATLYVGKSGNGLKTIIDSHGYDTCVTTNSRRVERAIRVNY